ncbi:hypothetical protein ALI22I_18180 [Saccharothrix sp. ALI-22-I]|uniref:hypothetical protein n=1 Tax=Saccharothrix sp. ALI-22-I TaxID=1933778 RepID=UPI00097C7605|nr:hypothetical protein [Saccharothrix sp. ALI-22-I]ONI88888.1 hypothetical protein ALI22I_18180 [Saccharothrix sp. ALI-22-I]
MSKFLFVTWDGGGNQPPARRIAAELEARGHDTRWLTLPETPLDLSAVPPPDRSPMVIARIMANPAHVDAVRADLAAAPADVLVVDCLLFGALAAAWILELPACCLVHTAPGGFGGPDPGNPNAQRLLTAINEMHSTLGLGPVNDPWQIWAADNPVIASFPELDAPPAAEVPEFDWIGPILDDPTYRDAAARLQAAISATPGAPGAADRIEALAQTRAHR